ncbi:MAG: NAD(P)/FAD-dependent oxidoreductase [Bacteroidetes bacterium]|nr:NAD(P)/FAD-dependent oxidoreductase [Bacteroidota bacterium]
MSSRTLEWICSPDRLSPESLHQDLESELGHADFSFRVLRQTLDARHGNVRYRLQIQIVEAGLLPSLEREQPQHRSVQSCPEVAVVGAGPAGYFAALRLIELGFKPIVLERGTDVRTRRRDLVEITRNGRINPESNYCFGEGGAGTYSDGKLYTRSSKRGSVNRILDWLIYFGAAESIAVDSRPHIGTNKLPGIIADIRAFILDCGAEVRFDTRVTNLKIEGGKIKALELNFTDSLSISKVVLATGHSASDVFRMLVQSGLRVEAKPFALGLRVEHPQSYIDQLQYHGCELQYALPPASYQLVSQVKGRGVYSFCMCPGGIIAPCSTQQDLVVTNGWSPSKRNNPFANSGMVTEIQLDDVAQTDPDGLHTLAFQTQVERQAAKAGGGNQVAPAQRLHDFIDRKTSQGELITSYRPGVQSVNLNEVLPRFVAERLRLGFLDFQWKMKGFLHPDAVLVGVESRTSSPVRIPRDPVSLQHPEVLGLFPCGEGGGYAGGIVSAAIDGIRCAEALAHAYPLK